MLLGILHTISSCLIILSLLGKVIIHYYLDRSRGSNIGISSILLMPLQYLLPYKPAVKTGYNQLKFWCNFLLLLAVVSLVTNIIAGLLIYFR